MFELPCRDALKPVADRGAPRPLDYLCPFVVLGLIGRAWAGCVHGEKLELTWGAWSIALASSATLCLGAAAWRDLSSGAQFNALPGEAWLPLRGRRLRLLIYAPAALLCLALFCASAFFGLAGVGLAIRCTLWPYP